MDHDIFISHSQRAPEPTVALADELTRRGFRPWYDVNLLPGQYFGKVIDAAIDRAEAADFYPVQTFASVYKKPTRIEAALAAV